VNQAIEFINVDSNQVIAFTDVDSNQVIEFIRGDLNHAIGFTGGEDVFSVRTSLKKKRRQVAALQI